MNLHPKAAVNAEASQRRRRQTTPRSLLDGYAPRKFLHSPPSGPRSVQGEFGFTLAKNCGSPNLIGSTTRAEADTTCRYML